MTNFSINFTLVLSFLVLHKLVSIPTFYFWFLRNFKMFSYTWCDCDWWYKNDGGGSVVT